MNHIILTPLNLGFTKVMIMVSNHNPPSSFSPLKRILIFNRGTIPEKAKDYDLKIKRSDIKNLLGNNAMKLLKL